MAAVKPVTIRVSGFVINLKVSLAALLLSAIVSLGNCVKQHEKGKPGIWLMLEVDMKVPE